MHVVTSDGAITSKLLSEYDEDNDIVVSVVLAAPTPGPQTPVRKQPRAIFPSVYSNHSILILARDCHNKPLLR